MAAGAQGHWHEQLLAIHAWGSLVHGTEKTQKGFGMEIEFFFFFFASDHLENLFKRLSISVELSSQ